MTPNDILKSLEDSQHINELVWNASREIKSKADEEILVETYKVFYENIEKILLNEIHEKLGNLIKLKIIEKKLILQKINSARLVAYIKVQAIIYQKCLMACNQVIFGFNRTLTIRTFTQCAKILHRSNRIIVRTIQKILSNQDLTEEINLNRMLIVRTVYIN